MGLEFHDDGAPLSTEARVQNWQEARAQHNTAAEFCQGHVAHDDSELAATVVNGRLRIETRQESKASADLASGRPLRAAYMRLEIDLPTSILSELSEILIARAQAYEAMLP